jgi:propanol-preferring alcohol dehydrogenase
MKAMIMESVCNLSRTRTPLVAAERPDPEPGPGQVRIRVTACGVCHTELDEIEGRTPPPRLPVIPGHQVVGRVDRLGPGCQRLQLDDRVGVGWIFSACGSCFYCRRNEENLCSEFQATGRDADGGYAEFMVAAEDFAYVIPERFSDVQAAPLLCAGAIGYRSLRLTGLERGQRLGLTGFGASAHLVLKMVLHQDPAAEVFVFARSEKEQAFARDLGAVWAGSTEAVAPEPLHAVIDTTPAWKPVIGALKNLAPGGRLVINAIRKEAGDRQCLLDLDYPAHLWMEKEIKSVANVARLDVIEFIDLAASIHIAPETREYDLADANTALMELKERKIRGAKVLRIAS